MDENYRKFEFYLFGSYLIKNYIYDDIDCLMIVDSEKDLDYALEWTSNFKNKRMHFTIYTNEEFHDEKNKFSINGNKKLLEVSIDDFI